MLRRVLPGLALCRMAQTRQILGDRFREVGPGKALTGMVRRAFDDVDVGVLEEAAHA